MKDVPMDTRGMDMRGGNPFHPNKLGLYPGRLEKLTRREMVAPITTEVDLTDHGCNQGCAHCSFGSGAMKGGIIQINRAALHRTLTEMQGLGTRGVEFVGGGEPTVHREVEGIIKDTVNLGLDAGLITNGVLLNRVLPVVDQLRYVRVSLDSADPVTYGKLHGVLPSSNHHGKVLDNIRAVRDTMTPDQHGDMALGIGYLVVPPFNHTEGEIRRAVELANELGVDYMVFRPAQLREGANPEHWKEAQRTIQAVSDENEGNHTKLLGVAGIRWEVLDEGNHPTGLCESRPLVAVIKANGDIPHCILFRNEDGLVLGNINDKPFKEIWFGEENKRRLTEFEISGCPNPCKHYRYNEVVRGIQKGEVIFSAADLFGIGHPNHV